MVRYILNPLILKLKLICIFTRTLELLHHILKHHPTLRAKYSAFESLAKVQIADSALATKTPSTKKSKKRSIEDLEDELTHFEQRFAQMEKHMEGWMQGRVDEINLEPAEKDVPAVFQITEEPKDATSGKWRRYEGIWTPRPIGVL